MKQALRLFWIFFLLFYALCIWEFIQAIKCVREPFVLLHVLSVGQGDAVLLRACWNVDLLVDGGPDNSVVYALSRALPWWDKTIDMVMLSHPDADHVGGLPEVLSRYTVDTVVMTGVGKESFVYAAFNQLVNAQGSRVVIAGDVREIILGPMQMMILHPIASLADTQPRDVNDSSIVARVTVFDTSLLFTGDISSTIERALVKQYGSEVLDVAILKVAHHGSKSSSDKVFLEAVSPDVAVISSGIDNRYHHPSPVITQRLSDYGILWYDTQASGDLNFVITARGWKSLEK